MYITGIEVTVARKRQPAQYEEGHVGVKLTATVGEGENYQSILGGLLDTAAHFVSHRVGLPQEGKPVFGGAIASVTVTGSDGSKATTGPTTVAEPKAEKPKKAEKPAAERGQIATNPENRVQPESDIPGEPAKPAAETKPAAAPAKSPVDDIPGETAKPAAAPAAAEEITPEALSSFVSGIVKAGRITVDAVKAEMGKASVARLADLSPEGRVKFKLLLEKLAKPA